MADLVEASEEIATAGGVRGLPTVLHWPGPMLGGQGDARSSDLWAGSVTLNAGSGEAAGTGVVRWQWLPVPQLQLDLDTEESWASAQQVMQPAAVRLDGVELGAYAAVNLRGGAGVQRLLEVDEMTVGDASARASAVRFAVPNFPRFLGEQVRMGASSWYGRFEAEMGPWHVRLDGVADGQGRRGQAWTGHAVTHVGMLSRTDGAGATVADARTALSAVRWLLTLLRGGYTAPIAWRGENDGELVWLHMTHAWPVDVWPAVAGLMPIGYLQQESPEVGKGLTSALASLLELLEDPDWRGVLERSLQWYVAANNGRHMGDLILSQAGLELLAYAHLVLSGRMRADGFTRLRAADQIRLSLTMLDIPVEIPEELPELRAFAAGAGADAPEVVSVWRNSVTHPPTRKRPDQYLDLRLQDQARTLGLRQFELALLATLNYSGLIHDRMFGAMGSVR